VDKDSIAVVCFDSTADSVCSLFSETFLTICCFRFHGYCRGSDINGRLPTRGRPAAVLFGADWQGSTVGDMVARLFHGDQRKCRWRLRPSAHVCLQAVQSWIPLLGHAGENWTLYSWYRYGIRWLLASAKQRCCEISLVYIQSFFLHVWMISEEVVNGFFISVESGGGVCFGRGNCRLYFGNDHLKLGFATFFLTFGTVSQVDILKVLFCSLAVFDPRVGHTMGILSPFIYVFCHSDWMFHEESCPLIDVVHPGDAWSSSPACICYCSLHCLFFLATPLFPHGVTWVF